MLYKILTPLFGATPHIVDLAGAPVGIDSSRSLFRMFVVLFLHLHVIFRKLAPQVVKSALTVVFKQTGESPIFQTLVDILTKIAKHERRPGRIVSMHIDEHKKPLLFPCRVY